MAEYEQAMTAEKTDPQVVKALRQAFERDGWKGYWRKNLNNLVEKSARLCFPLPHRCPLRIDR